MKSWLFDAVWRTLPPVTPVRPRRLLPLVLLVLGACTQGYHVPVRTTFSPAPPGEAVRHSGRLWLLLADHTRDVQCSRGASSEQPVCYSGVQGELADALARGLWPTFPSVAVKEHGDDVEPGDYLLWVEVRLRPQVDGAARPGWATDLEGRWQLVRDGLPVVGERVASRSRADFAYGPELGIGAGEVIDAVAIRIASVLSTVPERRPEPPIPLPPVEVRDGHGPAAGAGILLARAAAP